MRAPAEDFEALVGDLSKKMKMLVLYDANLTHVRSHNDYIMSFHRYSNFDVKYAHAVNGAMVGFDINEYDVIVISYCCVLYQRGRLGFDFADRLKAFSGVKVAVAQDEYDNTEVLRQRINELGVDIVLTLTPQDHMEKIYPAARFPNTTFVTVLTGYAPELENPERFCLPLRERPIPVGYRGRNFGPWHGELGFLKVEIGRRVRLACRRRGLACDIEWAENRRIYGDDWFRFIGSCRAMLGVESGSTILDADGALQAAFRALKAENPRYSYQAFRPRLAEREGEFDLSLISPRLLENILLRTPQILIEGRYRDLVRPDEHYIPLRRDFSNLDAALDRLNDLDELEAMAERAYRDVIVSGVCSYRRFVLDVEQAIRARLPGKRREGAGAPAFSAHPLAETPSDLPSSPEAAAAKRRDFERLVPQITSLRPLCGKRRLFIYGAGRGGALLEQALSARGAAVAGFIDSRRGGELNGLRVYALDEFIQEVATGAADDLRVAVASQYYYEIIADLLARGVAFDLANAYPLVEKLIRLESRKEKSDGVIR